MGAASASPSMATAAAMAAGARPEAETEEDAACPAAPLLPRRGALLRRLGLAHTRLLRRRLLLRSASDPADARLPLLEEVERVGLDGDGVLGPTTPPAVARVEERREERAHHGASGGSRGDAAVADRAAGEPGEDLPEIERHAGARRSAVAVHARRRKVGLVLAQDDERLDGGHHDRDAHGLVARILIRRCSASIRRWVHRVPMPVSGSASQRCRADGREPSRCRRSEPRRLPRTMGTRAMMDRLRAWSDLVEKVNGRRGATGRCASDGHYECARCSHLSPEADRFTRDRDGRADRLRLLVTIARRCQRTITIACLTDRSVRTDWTACYRPDGR